MRRIKVHYYSVSVPDRIASVSDTLQKLQQTTLDQRTRIIGTRRIRLDEVTPVLQKNGAVNWHLKFTKFREDNWPGVSASSAPSKDLELKADESLSEETHVVFSSVSNRMVIQYSHYGVRAAAVKDYLNAAIDSPVGYFLMPVLTNEALEVYNSKQIVTAVEASIEGVTEADIAFMEGSGLEAVLKKSIQSQVSTFQFKFSVDARVKKNQVDRGWVTRLVDLVRSRAGESDKLSVTAKANEEDAVEVIDLMASRKVTFFEAAAVRRTAGRRYNSEQLFALLDQSMRDWK